MKFRARWFDPQKGKVQETVQEAVSVQAAALQLQNQGVIVLALELAESKVHRLVGTMAFFERLRGAHFDAAWWCTEVRVLLGAGMTVVEAIDTVLAQSASAQTREVNQSLAHHLQQGLSLSVAMSRQQVFPAVLLAGVLAGERSGALIEA